MEFTLSSLIEKLERHHPDKVIKNGFTCPHSYRGDYNCVAFEPAENITVREMLCAAKSALGETFTGYNGGEYIMDNFSIVYIAKYGLTGDKVGELLMSYLLGEI